MQRSWPILAVVAAVGIVAGVAIAGRPSASDPLVIDPSSLTTVVSTTLVSTPSAGGFAGSALVVSGATTTTKVAPNPTTTSSTTTRPPPNPRSAATTTTLRDRTQLRVVVANAASFANIASLTAVRLRELGYESVVPANAPRPLETSTAYFRPGFEAEAQRVVVDLGGPAMPVVPLGDVVATPNDGDGDVIVVLGIDARP